MSQRRYNEFAHLSQGTNSWLRSGANVLVATAVAVIGGTQIASQGHAAQVGGMGITFAGVPPASVTAPPQGRIVSRAQEQAQAPSWILGGVVPIATQPELYRRIVQSPQPDLTQQALLRSGVIPASVGPPDLEISRTTVVAGQPDVGRQLWLWPGEIPVDITVNVTQIGTTAVAAQRHADHLIYRSVTGSGVLPDNVAPASEPVRGWIGMAQDRPEPRSVVGSGVAPAPELPEVYRRIVQGRLDVQQPASAVFAKTPEAPPAVPIPIENARAIVARRESRDVQPSWTWRGQVPADVVPLITQTGQTTVSSQGRPDLAQKRAVLVRGIPPPDVEPPGPIYVPEENRRIIRPRLESTAVQPSWIWRGSVIPDYELVYAQLVMWRDPDDRVSPILRGGVPPPSVAPAVVPTENRRNIVGRLESTAVQPSWLWRGQVPANVAPPSVPIENRRLIVGRAERQDVQPSWVWRGNAIPDYEIVYAQLITWNDPPAAIQGVKVSGVMPADVLPPKVPVENRRIIAPRRESIDVQPSLLRLGVMPADVIPPKVPEECQHLIVGRIESRDVQPSWAWRGEVPADYIPPPPVKPPVRGGDDRRVERDEDFERWIEDRKRHTARTLPPKREALEPAEPKQTKPEPAPTEQTQAEPAQPVTPDVLLERMEAWAAGLKPRAEAKPESEAPNEAALIQALLTLMMMLDDDE